MARIIFTFSFALLGSTLGLSPFLGGKTIDLNGIAAPVIPRPSGSLFSDLGIGYVGPLQPQLLAQEEDPQDPEDPEDPEDSETRIQQGRVVKKLPGALVGLVYYQNGQYKGPFCTATCITPEYVLTAAHCTAEMKGVQMQAVSGLSDLRAYSMRVNRRNKNVSISDFTYEDVKHHEGYKGDKDLFLNDIAIIKLKTPLDNCKPIQLAGQEAGYTDNLIANGWGLKNCWSSSAEAAREANGTFVDRQSCSEKWSRARDNTPIPESQICVTYKADGRDAAVASGDSGGPVYSQTSNGPVQLGIASHVIFEIYYPPYLMCVDTDVPQVYQSVPATIDWIKQNAPGVTVV